MSGIHSAADGAAPHAAADGAAAPRPRNRPAAVLFDLDGLLVDSEPLWSLAERELAAHYGRQWTSEIKATVVGTPLAVAVPTMLRLLGLPAGRSQVTETGEWLLTRMAGMFRASLPLRPGALALLDGLAAQRMPLALVSSSYRMLVDAALPSLGADRFATTVAGDEVVRGKPNPEPYLTAARRLGAEPRRCVVFEDSTAGVASAEAAGCRCVAVPDVAPVPSTPDRPVLASLTEVDPARLRCGGP